MNDLIIDENSIKDKIYTIRNLQVMLDKDLAWLYGVETKVLNQAVKRNIKRFPSDFMFQLSKEEFEN
ncbi:MAG: ORF6N domain-containing protein [Arcobacteraceae bacterium]